MSLETSADHERWLRTFSHYWDNLPHGPFPKCPACGKSRLDLVLRPAPDARSGAAFFWCANCLNGIVVSRVPMREGVDVLPFDADEDKRLARIPNFQIPQS